MATPVTRDPGFYREPARMTSAGRHAGLLSGLPHSLAELAGIAQGLLIHEHLSGP